MTWPPPPPPGPPGPPGLPQWWPEPEDPGPGRLRAWLAADPAKHGLMLGTPALWVLGKGLHAYHVTPAWCATGTLAAAVTAAVVAQWIAARPVPAWADPPETLGAGEAALGAGAAGGWVTAATVYGETGGLHWLITAALIGGALAAWYGWLRSHDAVQAARARRDDERTRTERKAFWDDLTRRVDDLAGCDLIEHITTLVGEQVCLDTRGTGRLASAIRTRAVEERIGELLTVPRGRIDCWLDDMPGRIWISVRSKDPWKYPVLHPLVSAKSPAARYFTVPATVRRPLVIGLDPEDGEPFGLSAGPGWAGLPVWEPDQGGRNILIAAAPGGGKTNLISVATERLTACEDNRTLQINLGAPAEMRAWSACCPVNALGRHALGRARATLAWVVNYIDDWAEGAGDDAYATPTAARPHLTVIIDEVADVAADAVCKAFLRSIVQKGRKAGVTLIIAGQRGTATWIGGADVRALIDYVVAGRFTQPGEIDKVTGVHLDLPDFAGYGGGAHGVFMIVNRGTGAYDRGRVVKLKEPRDMRRIARTRAHLAAWTPAGMDAEQARLWDLITGEDEVGPDDWEGPVVGGDDQDTAPPVLTPHHPGPSGPGVPDVAGVPAELLPRLMMMIRRDEGVSAGEAAKATGRHPETVRKYLTAIAAAGRAQPRGNTKARRYYATDRPPLTLVRAGDDDTDRDEGGDDTR